MSAVPDRILCPGRPPGERNLAGHAAAAGSPGHPPAASARYRDQAPYADPRHRRPRPGPPPAGSDHSASGDPGWRRDRDPTHSAGH